MSLVMDSSLPESHYLRELAIALAACDALAGQDSSTIENAVLWARKLFTSVEENPIHDGDCVYACMTCMLCWAQGHIEEARERSGLDEEGLLAIGPPRPPSRHRI